jgi:ElaB/YqjD/DUF883 family membrane-anchored ribosome-binding protein
MKGNVSQMLLIIGNRICTLPLRHVFTMFHAGRIGRHLMRLPKFETEWDRFSGFVAVTWDRLSETELLQVHGNFSELVHLIMDAYHIPKFDVEQQLETLYTTYMETRHVMTQEINSIQDTVQSRSAEIADVIKQKAAEYQTAAKEKYKELREKAIDPAVEKSEEFIKVHPFSMVLGAFGVGFLIGGIIGLISKRD